MSRSRKHKRDEEPLSPEEQAATETFSALAAESRAERASGLPVGPIPTGAHAPAGEVPSPERRGQVAALQAAASIAANSDLPLVSWRVDEHDRRIIGDATFAPPSSGRMYRTPDEARAVVLAYAKWLAQWRVEQHGEEPFGGRYLRIFVQGTAFGVWPVLVKATVDLPSALDPSEPPPTTEWEAVPEAKSVATAEHPYDPGLGPMFQRGPVQPAAELPRRRIRTHTPDDDQTGDAA